MARYLCKVSDDARPDYLYFVTWARTSLEAVKDAIWSAVTNHGSREEDIRWVRLENLPEENDDKLRFFSPQKVVTWTANLDMTRTSE